MIIGVTGGSGCGKSTVVSALKAEGFYVIDADITARECVKIGKPAYFEIKQYFGDGVFFENGELNRKKLGSIVFSDSEKLAVLNSITHKHILRDIENEIKENCGKDIIIDAALLNKGGLSHLCDAVVLITADKDVRANRITARDSITEENAKNRIESQESDEEYMSCCDFAVDNSGRESIECIKNKIIGFIDKIRIERE